MKKLKQQLIKAFGRKSVHDSFSELTLTIDSNSVVEICTQLRDEFNFDILVDLCGIDYLAYGESDWDGNASTSGYGRAREVQLSEKKQSNRFGVVYHLLSVSNNNRLRVKVLLSDDSLMISLIQVFGIQPIGMKEKPLIYLASCLRTIPICAEF